ncbi:MAG: replicative DNA helicase [Caldilineae bacterium]|nr:MAG: replicative DNA helicase [Caldilineae bacterium]
MSTRPDKTVPANIEAEEALLGSLMIDPDVVVQVATIVEPEDFYVQRHGWVYDAIRHLHDQRQPVDFLTVTDELERRGQLEDVGGAAFISSLINAVPSAIHAYHYAQIVQRTSTLRKLIQAAGEIARKAYDDSQDVKTVVDEAEALIFSISERQMLHDLTPINLIMRNVMDELDELNRRRGELLGVPTGFRDLDRLLGGLQKSDLIIVAARPGMGKTSLALTIALNAAKLYKKCAAIFSLEMSNEQLVLRLLAQEARINSQRMRLGQIRDEEWDRLARASAVLSECAIYIDDSAAITPFELRTKARRLYAKQPIDLLIVDYMQLMHGGTRTENRVQEISLISRSLKQLARELHVPVVALSQLSRQVETRADKHPQLSDLRESGSIEQDADVVMFVYREDVYKKEESERKNIAEIIVAKHRHGPTGSVDLFFEEEYTSFKELALRTEELRVQ